MTIRFLCPLGHKLAVPDALAGKKGRCPECNQRVYIPRLDSPSIQPLDDEPAGYEAGEAAASLGEIALEGEEGDLLSPQEGGSIPAAEMAAWAELGETGGGGSSAPPPLPDQAMDHGGEPPDDLASIAGLPEVPPSPVLPLPENTLQWDEEGYVPDAGKVQTVYMLAIALGAFTAFAAAPALRHINLMDAPWWARVVLILSAMQLVYIAWMVSLPDWSTVWIGMIVFAIVAAVYGVGCTVVVATPELEAVNFLDLDGPEGDPLFRKKVAAWCLVMLLLGTVLTYACGRFSGKWRKQYEIAKAARSGKQT